MMDHETPFEALSDRTRRLAFSCLEDRDGSVPVESLAADVVAARDDVRSDEVSDDERRAATVQLYHVHLPKLDEAGLVRFDHEDETVARTTGGVAEQTAQILQESTVS
ncbi:DUF7344 domain-containing protein [Halopelagius inordinatus]|nr:hypothetical protein [Halopelagius inordinatus]